MTDALKILAFGLGTLAFGVLPIVFRRPITKFIIREQFRMYRIPPESWKGQRWGILAAGIWGVAMGLAVTVIGIVRLIAAL